MNGSVHAILKRNPNIRAIGFDMDGVLFATRKRAALTEIGFMSCASFLRETRRFPKETDYFDTLRVPELEKDTHGMNVIHKGTKLPTILTAWQMGLQSSKKLKEEIYSYYDSDACTLSDAEIDIYKKIANLMLDPVILTRTRKQKEDGTELLDELNAINAHLMFGLSNWDKPSFKMLKVKYPEVFNKLEAVIISGEECAVKPHKRMYYKMLKKLKTIPGYHDLKYEEILFIDDEPANIKTAKRMGMYVYCNL